MHLFFYLIWGELTLIGRETLLGGGVEKDLDLKNCYGEVLEFGGWIWD